MTIRARCPVALLGLWTLMAVLIVGPDVAAAAIEVKLDDQTSADSLVIIDLGPVAVSTPRLVGLTIANLDTGEKTLFFHPLGSAVVGGWVDEQGGDVDPSLQRVVGAGESAALEITFNPSAKTKGLEMQGVLLRSGAGDHTLIVFRYLRFDSMYSFKVESGTLSSPVGDDWSKRFKVCSGPDPAGYRYVNSAFKMIPKNGGNRKCGHWGKCYDRGYSTSDYGACWEFKIQGHEGNLDRDEARYAEGRLTATYALATTPARIVEPTELAGAEPAEQSRSQGIQPPE